MTLKWVLWDKELGHKVGFPLNQTVSMVQLCSVFREFSRPVTVM